ncbi:MAG TPA: hypothetical protein VL100_07625 [Croceibacterium sp.]|nr:hypothetical protein [Croceibacterium sp.]
MIAIAGPNLPLEILQASGRYAGPLPIVPDRETPRAGEWLESKFAPWAFALLEAWAEGEYDDLERVLFSRAEDNSQRLYYYVCELQARGLIAGPKATIFDVAKIPRTASAERTIAKARDLARELDVSDAAIEEAIAASNRTRAQAPAGNGERVCLLAGTSVPDGRLHRAITSAGFEPVGQTLVDEWMDLGDTIEERTGDPAAAVGRQVHESTSGSRSFADPGARLAARIAAVGAKAVIVWQIEEDEAQSWQLPAQRRVLENSGLPHLVLTRRDWRARDGAPVEIVEFLSRANA